MKLDRTTYEIFIIDYLEGNLNPVQVSELLLFLEQNPDLKQEFEGVELVVLHQDKIAPLDKSFLIKPESFIITAEVENLLLAKAEGDATAEQESELEHMQKKYPQLIKEEQYFITARLDKNEHIRFPNKSRLKKFNLPAYLPYVIGIAAVFLAVMILPGLLPVNDSQTVEQQPQRITPNLNNQIKDTSTAFKVLTAEAAKAKISESPSTKNLDSWSVQRKSVTHHPVSVSKPAIENLISVEPLYAVTQLQKVNLQRNFVNKNEQPITVENEFPELKDWLKTRLNKELSNDALLAKVNTITQAEILIEKNADNGKVKRIKIEWLGFEYSK
ncbi:MAG: hypothetical protein MUC81_00990 [Bacteroidia bacterium]|jgi:hypothetical protein|nr:hypothetical protein [Bacteroidia bacterium]